MVNISSTNNIYKSLGSVVDKTSKGKFLANQLEKARKQPAKYAGKLIVLSFISKDVINTIIYTTQSLNNKKIPEDKRSFVAANDLILGFFNFGGQILSASLVERYLIPKITAKRYTGHIKDANEVDQYLYSKAILSPDSVEHKVVDYMNLKGMDMKDAKEITEKAIKKIGHASPKGKGIAEGVTILGAALATTALVKRTISPLCATPLAGLLGDKWDKDKKEKAEKLASAKSAEQPKKPVDVKA